MERFNVIIETRHGARIVQRARSLKAARTIFNEEIAWESTKRITIYDENHNVVLSRAGDFAFVDEYE